MNVPEETLQPGRYTVTFELKIDPLQYEGVADTDVICKTQISHNAGKNVDQTVDVKRSDFDEEGKTKITNILSVGTVAEGYTYSVITDENHDVDVSRIRIQQTPLQITLKKYNVHHMPIREVYYDGDGKPSYSAKGYAALSRSYNSADKATGIQYLNAEGQPVQTTDGYAEIRYEYNEKMQLVRESYYDENGDSIALKNGYAQIRYAYDSRGNRAEYRYCDANGNLIARPDGFAMLRYQFDENRRWIRCDYYGQEEEKVFLPAGYCSEEREYNTDGLRTVSYFLGTDNQPVLRTDLYAEVHYVYDDKKMVSRIEYYDAEGKRTKLKSGISALNYERDSDGNIIREEYFGTEDEKICNTSGVAEIRKTYNNFKQKTSDTYFGLDGKPVLISKKYVRVDYTYDQSGKLIRRTYKDASGKVVEEKEVK